MKLPFMCEGCRRMVFRGQLEDGLWWHWDCWDAQLELPPVAASDAQLEELFHSLAEDNG